MVTFTQIIQRLLNRKKKKIQQFEYSQARTSSVASEWGSPVLEFNENRLSPKNYLIPQLNFSSFSKDYTDMDDATSTERNRRQIRNTPTTGCKYLDVWQRIRMKIKSKLMMKHLSNDIKLYGTSALVQDFIPNNKIYRNESQINYGLSKSGTVILWKEAKIPFLMFHPNSTSKSIWNIILAILLLYTATVMPYKIAFIDNDPYDGWWYTDIVIDALFLTDVLVNLSSAFYNADGELVVNRWKIFINYLKSWMILDLVACFPFNLIEGDQDEESQSSSGGYNNLLRLARLPRLYRLFRISRIFKMVKHCKNSEMLEKIQDFFSVKHSAMRMVSFFITVFICIHIIACFWYFAAKLEGFHPDTWVARYGYIDEDNMRVYLVSIYWAFTTLSTVGYGDISPYTSLEIIIAMLWMIFGLCFFSFTIGSLSSMLSSIDTKETVLTNKLAIIDEFAKESNLSRDLKLKLRHALKYSTEQTGFSWGDKQNIFNELPRKLKHEVALFMHQGAATQLQFFQDRDPVFICAIIPFLQHIFAQVDDYIYKKGEYADEMYFIIKGRVGYVYEEDLKVYKTISRGSYFGDIELIERCSRKYTLKAIVNSDLLTLNRQLALNIEQDFTQIWKEMVKVAEKRDKYNQEALEEHKEVLKLRQSTEIKGKTVAEIKRIVRNNIIKRKREKKLVRQSTQIEHCWVEQLANQFMQVQQRLDAMQKDINELKTNSPTSDSDLLEKSHWKSSPILEVSEDVNSSLSQNAYDQNNELRRKRSKSNEITIKLNPDY